MYDSDIQKNLQKIKEAQLAITLCLEGDEIKDGKADDFLFALFALKMHVDNACAATTKYFTTPR